MHLPTLSTLLTVVFLSSSSLSLNIPAGVSSAAAPDVTGSNPLPPSPPTPPIGPDNYPIENTDLKLMVQRPYGPALPFGSTILCLASAQADLDRQYAEKGDVIIGVGYTWEYQGIKVYIQAIYKRLMTLSKASTALNSVVKLMDGYPELSTKIVTIILAEQGEGVIARIMITRSTLGVTGEVTVSLNGTTPNLAAPSSLAALDPKNYRVPHTAITVSLEGRPPFGSPLPKDPIILALASAQVAASDTIAKFGDIPVSSLWRFEENGIRIDVNTQLSIDCKFSTLETGLLGLVDLINEPGGVGAVAADFILEEDGLGEVASGRLRLEGTYGRVASAVGSAKPVATLVEGGKTASVTLVGGAVETRVVGSA